MRPPSELKLKDGSILKILKPLYGVPEAGNHWFHTYHRHHTENLHMKQSTYDPCLLFANKGSDNGFGIVGLQTDDTLFLADEIFAAAEEHWLREAKLSAKDREKLTTSSPLKFNGGQIRTDGKAITLSRNASARTSPLSP